MSSVSWIEGFAADRPGHEMTHAPRLLAPLAALLRSRSNKRLQISSSSSTSILDSVATRIDEERDITRYLTNLLIFLGLLGTFWGLATTVPAFVETIRNLLPKEGEAGVVVFERLMAGLESQLAAWARPSPHRFLVWLGRSSWAFSSCSRATDRTASIANWRNGSPGSPSSVTPRTGRAAAIPRPSWARSSR